MKEIKQRLGDIAKDFGLPNKELVTLLKTNTEGEKKYLAASALSEKEQDILLTALLDKHKVESLDDYFAQATAIEVKTPEITAQPEAEAEATETKKEKSSKKAAEPKKKSEKATSAKAAAPKAPAKKETATQTQPESKATVNTDNQIKRPEKRTVDTRSSHVDLDKYNERYDQLASERVKPDNTVAKKQKITQKSQQYRGRNKAPQRRRETEEERLLRIANERKSKPITVTVPDEITVNEFALRAKITAAEVIKNLLKMGVFASINDTIDFDTAYLVGEELHVRVEKEVVVTIEERIIDDSEDDDGQLIPRSPVIVVMGHVDHGKTSILDMIRKAHVAEGEAGGITQHIGAYRVNLNGQHLTFLDTPGHAAFTTMRARGAQVTDIAILVVAADDGIMPQTIEAINHAKAAGVSIIVAINKMDKMGVNPENIKQQLTEYELIPEEWGGDVICVPVSAKTGMGIDDLLENVLLVAEMKELKANPNRAAKGTVIEARLDKGRGPIATVLIQNGTMHIGDIVVAGTAVGRVRAMMNDKGEKVTEIFSLGTSRLRCLRNLLQK